MARVAPWHARGGYGRSSRTRTHAHATAHTHIHDERLRYPGALKCAPPPTPARRAREQSPHYAPLLLVAALPRPLPPPPPSGSRASPPLVKRRGRRSRRSVAPHPSPARSWPRRVAPRTRPRARFSHPPRHVILHWRRSPSTGSTRRDAMMVCRVPTTHACMSLNTEPHWQAGRGHRMSLISIHVVNCTSYVLKWAVKEG